MSDKPVQPSSQSANAMPDPAVQQQETTGTPLVEQPLESPVSLSASHAEVVEMQLDEPGSGDVKPTPQSDQTDPRLQMARNLDHIDEISAQLADIHELIEPEDELFSRAAPRPEFTPRPTTADHTATQGAAVLGFNSTGAADDSDEAAKWHGPELGQTMRLPAADSVAVATEPEPTSARAPRRSKIRSVLVPLAIAAAVLAIPVMVIASLQPWRDGDVSGRATDSLRGGHSQPSVGTPQQPEEVREPQGFATPAGEPVLRVYPARTSGRRAVIVVSTSQGTTPSAVPKRGEVAPLVVSAERVGSSPVAGSPVAFKVRWSDGSGFFGKLTYTTSDGDYGGVPDAQKNCNVVAPPSSGTVNLSHTFKEPGANKTITFTLSTYTCDGKQETSQVTVSLDVAAPTPSPTPSPSPTPTLASAPAPSFHEEPSGRRR